MVKEVPQAPQYQCENCYRIYNKFGNAQKCEQRGLPEFKYNIGDNVETVVKTDGGGAFAKVEITDRYHLNHRPFYTFQHPQIQRQYLQYPEVVLDLPDKFNKFKERAADDERALRSRGIWREFMAYLRKGGITKYPRAIIAEPIILFRGTQ